MEGGEDSLDVRQKPHVEHVVRLVEDQGLDLGKVETTLLQQVEHSPGTPDHDLWAAAQAANLRARGHSAEEGQRLDLAELRKQADLSIDLDGEFPGRCQHEHEGAGARLLDQPLKYGQRKGRRFSGSGLGQAHHVLSPETGRNRFDLNRSGFVETRGFEATGQYGIKLKAVESALRDCTRLCARQKISPPYVHVESTQYGPCF